MRRYALRACYADARWLRLILLIYRDAPLDATRYTPLDATP